VIVLDRIQDPGNAGAILRSAEAFGASGIVLLESSVQISNGKFIRAAAGSLFRVPVLRDIGRDAMLDECRRRQWNLFALHAGAGTYIHSVSWRESCALIVGNEGQGIHSALLAASQPVSIPTAGVESLNAATACSIALYEAASQRNRA
jgi:TrmH family RNA methyltransferase